MTSKSFNLKSFCQYHRENGYDNKKCYSLKNKVQDLIDSNDLSIDNLDGSENKYVLPYNKNKYIYTNTLPLHDTNTIAQHYSMNIMYDSKTDELNHVVNQVEHVVQSISPPQSQPLLQSRVSCPPQLKPKPKLKPQPKPRQQPKKK